MMHSKPHMGSLRPCSNSFQRIRLQALSINPGAYLGAAYVAAIMKHASAPERLFSLPAECAFFLCVQINLYAQLHNFGVYPLNQTAYGTPRLFKAMIANVATSNSTALEKMTGTLTFQDGQGQQLCNATLANNNTMSGMEVRAAHSLDLAALAFCSALHGIIR